MPKAILITGIAGSGKSAVCARLNELGYKAFSIEEIEGLFTMVDKKTGLPYADYNNDNLDAVKQHDWICDKDKLKKLMNENSEDLSFYCGTASNLDDLLPLFDTLILLQISPETLRQRLTDRTNNDFGQTAEVQNWILSWQKPADDHWIKKGALVIDANQQLNEVVAEILNKIAN